MRKLATRYPGYGWDQNVGYGTPEHLAGLLELGATPHHRRTFAPVQAVLKPGETGYIEPEKEEEKPVKRKRRAKVEKGE